MCTIFRTVEDAGPYNHNIKSSTKSVGATIGRPWVVEGANPYQCVCFTFCSRAIRESPLQPNIKSATKSVGDDVLGVPSKTQ